MLALASPFFHIDRIDFNLPSTGRHESASILTSKYIDLAPYYRALTKGLRDFLLVALLSLTGFAS